LSPTLAGIRGQMATLSPQDRGAFLSALTAQVGSALQGVQLGPQVPGAPDPRERMAILMQHVQALAGQGGQPAGAAPGQPTAAPGAPAAAPGMPSPAGAPPAAQPTIAGQAVNQAIMSLAESAGDSGLDEATASNAIMQSPSIQATIRQMTTAGATDQQIIQAITSAVFAPGPWAQLAQAIGRESAFANPLVRRKGGEGSFLPPSPVGGSPPVVDNGPMGPRTVSDAPNRYKMEMMIRQHLMTNLQNYRTGVPVGAGS